MIRRLIYILLFVILAGCEIIHLPISVDPAESKIAVSSLIGPEQTILVTASESFSALSAQSVDSLNQNFLDQVLLDRARLTLSYSGGTDTLFKIGNLAGFYGAQMEELEPYEPLTLTVFDSTSGSKVVASTPFLPPVSLDSVIYSREITELDTTTHLTYRFQDRPEENYYVLHAYNLPTTNLIELALSDTASADSIFVNQELLFFETLITDASAVDGIIREEASIPLYAANDTVAVALSHISEGYYRFLQARSRSGGLISSLANEPVNHPTNVEGGYGYFTAHQIRFSVVAVEDFEE